MIALAFGFSALTSLLLFFWGRHEQRRKRFWRDMYYQERTATTRLLDIGWRQDEANRKLARQMDEALNTPTGRKGNVLRLVERDGD